MPKRNKKMGTFRVDCRVEHIASPRKSARVDDVLVDTGSDSTWLPARVLENARVDSKQKKLLAAGPMLAAGNHKE